MKNVFIVRHGERIDHVDKTWSFRAKDSSNPELTIQGIEQSYNTGLQIGNLIGADTEVAIVSSPFLRCLQTAENIHQGLLEYRKDELASSAQLDPIPYSVPLFVDYGLSEWQSPEYFVTPPKNPPEINSSLIQSSFTQTEEVEYPIYPESESAVTIRFIRTAFRLLSTFPSSIIIVTHADAVQAIVQGLSPNSTFPDRVKYCSLTHLVQTHSGNDWSLKLLCSSHHLSC